MVKTNKELVNSLEATAAVEAWDKGNEFNEELIRCENCRFRNYDYWLKQDEVCCNMNGLIMKRDDFCSYGVRYDIDEE